ncbi:MAG: universal stress protein [Pseudomonadota bacterium]
MSLSETADTPAMPGATLTRLLAVTGGGADDGALLKEAFAFAARTGAEMCVLSVVEPPSDLAAVAHASGLDEAGIKERLCQERRDGVKALVASLSPDTTPEIAVRVGKPFIEIIAYVHAHDVDFVMKDADDVHGIASYVFASTDQHLLRKCPCPVWLRVGAERHGPRTVLAAVDVDRAMASEPSTLEGLNRTILQTAALVAGEGGGPIHVLHVWEAPGEGLVRTWSNAPKPRRAAEDYVASIHTAHSNALADLVESAAEWMTPPLKRQAFLPRLERGDPRTVIPQYVADHKVDVIVMGTIARTGVPGFIIGNTAEDVLNAVDCAVVTVKPPGYVSPLRTAG